MYRENEAALRDVYSKYSETKFSKSVVPNNLAGKLLGFEDYLRML